MNQHIPPRFDVSEADRAAILQRANIRTYRKNYYVVNQGDESGFFYFIVTGSVEVVVDYPGNRTLICRLGEGEYFGELGMLTGADRSASVLTVVDSTFAILRKDNFETLLSESAEFRRSVIRKMASMVYCLTAKVSLTSLDSYSRLRFYLYQLASEVDGQLVIEGSWTQQHLAQLAGCARETVSRIMAELVRGSWIEYQKHRIVLHKTLPERF